MSDDENGPYTFTQDGGWQKAPDYARLAVLQTERAYLDRELVRAGNHSRTTPTPNAKRYFAVDALIREELDID